MSRLSRSFYHRPTLDVARDLIGKVLVHNAPVGLTSGVIVEVEAYIGEDDAACHAASGLTQRNLPLYGRPGHAYVYLNYGVHYLLNVVTESIGRPGAVLVRAVEPGAGEALMRCRRHGSKSVRRSRLPTNDLCRGPGNIARSFGVTFRHNRMDMCEEPLYIQDTGHSVGPIGWSSRIGISEATERRWRVFSLQSKAVSGPRRLNYVK
ncbi:MAG: DNA-3-methyladenine glycosylase [Acidobacteriota bacterium]|nr:DNA-3-methyladenine glycosylase [Acidobacteriota bacterium]